VKVIVDTDMCQAHGECAFAAPEVFELGEDDVLRWVEEPDESLRPKVEQAVAACPVQAIRLEG
jgi:ferredoxin